MSAPETGRVVAQSVAYPRTWPSGPEAVARVANVRSRVAVAVRRASGRMARRVLDGRVIRDPPLVLGAGTSNPGLLRALEPLSSLRPNPYRDSRFPVPPHRPVCARTFNATAFTLRYTVLWGLRAPSTVRRSLISIPKSRSFSSRYGRI